MSTRQELSLEEIRTLTLEALRRFDEGRNTYGGGLQFGTLIPEVEIVAANKGLIPFPSGGEPRQVRMTEKEVEKIREVISSLIIQEVLMWGYSRHEPGPPWLTITFHGREVLKKGEIIPHDPDGYLKSFKEKVPQGDDLILKYLSESVQTFNRGNLLASPVMLGVASEAAFLDLFEAIRAALTNPDKIKKFDRLVNDISIRKKFDAVMAELAQIKGKLPKPLEESIETEIQGIFNLIRHERNDSGHPTGKEVSRSQMFVYLQLFVTYCSSLYRLIDWVKQNPL